MKVRQDFVFMFSLADGQSGFAFCPHEDMEIDQVKQWIESVLQEQKQKKIKHLNYLGKLHYDQMDPGIMEQLYVFEKYDPIWLCMIQHPS